MTDSVRRTYSNDQIGEVFCELIFEIPQTWTPAAYGLVLGKIRDMGFETATDMGFMVAPEGPRQSPPILMRFGNVQNTTLVQISPFLFSINQLKPYPGWAVFRPLVLEAVARCAEVVGPTVFKQFGLRYINRIPVPVSERTEGAPISAAEWLTVHPTVPEARRPYHMYGMQCKWLVQEDHILTVGVSRDTELPPDEMGFLLDLGYSVNLQPDWNLSHLKDLLETSHDAIYALFEECITEKTRRLFKEVEPHE
jgi:uncharacterized protein (TIGR04255 family)